MFPVRHKACHVRLFDSRYATQEMSGISPDISIKCPRCSRDKGHTILAQFRLELPKKTAPIPPESVYCSNLNCMGRLFDLALPYTLTDRPSDISIMCSKCKTVTWVQLGGIISVERD